jgi:hypothetical protein
VRQQERGASDGARAVGANESLYLKRVEGVVLRAAQPAEAVPGQGPEVLAGGDGAGTDAGADRGDEER